MTALSLLLALQSGTSVLAPNAYLTTPVAGLERTGAFTAIYPTKGHGFSKALQVTISRASADTNWTQLTLPNVVPIEKGDALVASVWMKGNRPFGHRAQAELLFEKSTEPWTKSITQAIGLSETWREFTVPFKAAESYAPGTAMLSLRLAFGAQTVEIGAVNLTNYGKSRSLEALVKTVAERRPLGSFRLRPDFGHPRQTMLGLGGDFCQPRYGHTEAMDVVGQYALDHLHVAHARIGLPLEKWTPEPGVYRDDAQAAASLQQLRLMAQRHIPTVLSIWEGPGWMLGGKPEQMGRELDPAKYDACIDAIAEYLVIARDKYGARPEYLSFNEPDYGVNFKFTPATMAAFIHKAGPKFAARGLKTKFLVGDTAGGTSAVAFDTPLLSDPTLAPYLGPISFHCWDVLSAPDESYIAIAALGRRFHKPVWCLEAGHDAALWEKSDPWASWENGLRTAMAYEKTIRLAEPTRMDYWTYQDNYPLVDSKGPKPYPAFGVMRQLEAVFAPDARVALVPDVPIGLQAIATVRANRTALLLVNSVGAGRATVEGLHPNTTFTVETSDQTATERKSMLRADRTGRLTVPVPTRSVVTAVGGKA